MVEGDPKIMEEGGFVYSLEHVRTFRWRGRF